MLLLDTHAFIWLASDPAKLSRPAKRMLEASSDSLAISLVTAWEVALLVKRGRLSLPLPPARYLEQAIRHHGITELHMSREVILHAVGLPDLHNDPFDRILIAEAQLRDGTLISKDRNIAAYPGTRVVW